MTTLLQLIKQQEGGRLHRNSNESDITTGYGIHRAKHPNAGIFSYIDNIAYELGIDTPSSEWTSDEISDINDNIKPSEEFKYTEEFYSNYFKFNLDAMPDPLKTSYASSYVNAGNASNIALKKSINYMIGSYFSNLSGSKVDASASIDKRTLSSIDLINLEIEKKANADYASIWNNVFLENMRDYYKEIIEKNPEKYAQYEEGWNNRLNALQSNVDNEDLVKPKNQLRFKMTKEFSDMALEAYKESKKRSETIRRSYQFVPVMYENAYYYVKFSDTNNAPAMIKKYNIQPLSETKIENIPNIFIEGDDPYLELTKATRVESNLEADDIRKKRKLINNQFVVIRNNKIVNSNDNELAVNEVSAKAIDNIKKVNL